MMKSTMVSQAPFDCFPQQKQRMSDELLKALTRKIYDLNFIMVSTLLNLEKSPSS